MSNHNPSSPPIFSQITTSSRTLSWCVFGSLVTLSGLSCFLGTFYDDEIFSISMATSNFSNLLDFIKQINSDDIHPPMAYVLNRLTFDVLGSWKAVQFVNGTLNAAAIAWFHRRTIEKVATRERLALTFVLATAVTNEMWGTCLLYTSDAADEEDSVDLGGRRIIKKKK